MKFIKTDIPDVIICEPLVHGDERGYFVETFRQDKLDDFLGYKINFVQDNESKSSKGVLRGLHYQLPPHAQTKLVRVIEGIVLDVAVDIRKNSATFGKHVSVTLSSENKRQLLIPRGFAHGFIVLSETATFAYKVDDFYSPEYDRGIAYNSVDLGIDWIIPKEGFQLSTKDKKSIHFHSVKNDDLFDIKENLYA